MPSPITQNISPAAAGTAQTNHNASQAPQAQQVSQAMQQAASDQIAKAVPDHKRVTDTRRIQAATAAQKTKKVAQKKDPADGQEEPRNSNGKYDVVA